MASRVDPRLAFIMDSKTKRFVAVIRQQKKKRPAQVRKPAGLKGTKPKKVG